MSGVYRVQRMRVEFDDGTTMHVHALNEERARDLASSFYGDRTVASVSPESAPDAEHGSR